MNHSQSHQSYMHLENIYKKNLMLISHSSWLAQKHKYPWSFTNFMFHQSQKSFLESDFVFTIVICCTIRCMQEFGDFKYSERFQTRWKTLILEELCVYLQSRPNFKADLIESVSLSTLRKYTSNILTCAGSTVSIPGEIEVAFYFLWLYAPGLWNMKIQISGWNQSSIEGITIYRGLNQ